jgi:hypothetical protein
MSKKLDGVPWGEVGSETAQDKLSGQRGGASAQSGLLVGRPVPVREETSHPLIRPLVEVHRNGKTAA